MSRLLKRRASGVLMHISSLPGRFGIGDMGRVAHEFADFLAGAGQRYWQVLPLTPTDAGGLYSPYSSPSAFACNPLFISPDELVEAGLLARDDIAKPPRFGESRIDYEAVRTYKGELILRAFANFDPRRDGEYERFISDNSHWLGDYALFAALREKFELKAWTEWPEELRDRDVSALAAARRELSERIDLEMFAQFVLYKQWNDLKKYCGDRGISIIGDIPIYVNHDSADVWANRDIFDLDGDGRPVAVSGVPPDYFSKTGQRWGNPLYKWGVLRERKFDWWIARFKRSFDLFDVVRIDHFRGFIAFWRVPARNRTAIRGAWVKAPADALFSEVARALPGANIIAEDLGVITDRIREVMHKFGFPGMRPLLFGFDGDPKHNINYPDNISDDCVVYTGTHDNNTARGWFEEEASDDARRRLKEYCGKDIGADDVSFAFIEIALKSRANTAIISMQDILGLPASARMNLPSSREGNWVWRMTTEYRAFTDAERFAHLTEESGRAR